MGRWGHIDVKLLHLYVRETLSPVDKLEKKK